MGRSRIAAAVLLVSSLCTGGQAAEPKQDETKATRRAANLARVYDVTLSSEGRLTGVLVDEQGKPLAARKVSLIQRPRIRVTALTDKQGIWQFGNVKGGQYEIASGRDRRLIRVWTHGRAPKNASRKALLVDTPRDLPRGQSLEFGGLSATELGLLGGAAAGAGYLIHEANESENSPN